MFTLKKPILSANAASSSSSGVKAALVVIALGLLPPAPLTRMSQLPSRARISSAARRMDSSSETSPVTAMHTPPAAVMPSTTASSLPIVRPMTATLAPSSARCRAMQEHKVPPPPVITATLSLKYPLSAISAPSLCALSAMPPSLLRQRHCFLLRATGPWVCNYRVQAALEAKSSV